LAMSPAHLGRGLHTAGHYSAIHFLTGVALLSYGSMQGGTGKPGMPSPERDGPSPGPFNRVPLMTQYRCQVLGDPGRDPFLCQPVLDIFLGKAMVEPHGLSCKRFEQLVIDRGRKNE